MIRPQKKKSRKQQKIPQTFFANKAFIRDFEHTDKKKRSSFFEQETVHILSMDYGIEFEGLLINGSIVWVHESKEFGKVSFYPKSNKVHIHAHNGWHDDGIRWIFKNLKV